MTTNLLPLLLGAGAAAYVVTQDRKKKEDDSCPPTTTITLGEMQSVATRSHEKFGSIADPAQEANFNVNQLLPAGCNRASKDSKFKLQIADVEKSWEISIPDAYMLTFASSLGGRVQGDALTKEQAEKFWARELDWYKKVTGKNFDITALHIEDLAKHLGQAMMGALKDMGIVPGKSSPRPNGNGNGAEAPPMGACPANYDWVFDHQEDAKLQAAFELGRQMNPNDPFKIADVMFDATVMPQCTKQDFESTVTMSIVMPGSSPESLVVMDLAALYAMFVMEAATKLGLGPAKMAALEDKVATNYQQLTGNPLTF